jgi:hypothetical protein
MSLPVQSFAWGPTVGGYVQDARPDASLTPLVRKKMALLKTRLLGYSIQHGHQTLDWQQHELQLLKGLFGVVEGMPKCVTAAAQR